MPQLTLEYSSNIIETDNLTDLLQLCNHLLVTALPTELVSCKSRAIEYKIYSVGEGHPNNAFVHVNLKIMPGRTPDILQNVGEKMLELLAKHFAVSLQNLQLQITLEISDLSPNYFKRVSE